MDHPRSHVYVTPGGAAPKAAWSFEAVENGDTLRGYHRYLPGISGKAVCLDGQIAGLMWENPFTVIAQDKWQGASDPRLLAALPLRLIGIMYYLLR